MAKDPTDRTSAKIAAFALVELRQLVADLYSNGRKAGQEDVLGALVLAARRAAIDDVKDYLDTYWTREAALKAASGAPVAPDEAAADES